MKEVEAEEGDDVADGVKARWCSIRDIEEAGEEDRDGALDLAIRHV